MLQRLCLQAHAMLDQCVVLSRNMIFVLNLWSGPWSRGTSTQLLEPVSLCLPVLLFLSQIIPKILYDLLGGEIRLKEMQHHSLQKRINFSNSIHLFFFLNIVIINNISKPSWLRLMNEKLKHPSKQSMKTFLPHYKMFEQN